LNIFEKMGNVGDKLADFGQSIVDSASHVAKSVNAMITEPKKPLPMPNFGDGRSADQLRTAAEIMYGMDTKVCVNIGFLGAPSTSKLALINSMRYIQYISNADCAADTGVASPKNLAVQYRHCDPAYKHVRFWDIADTTGTFEERCLYAFDAVVLLVTEVLRPGDIKLVKEANAVPDVAPILIVRTDMDLFVDREYGLNPAHSKDVIEGKNRQGPVIRAGLNRQLLEGGVGQCLDPCTDKCIHQGKCIYMVSSPGILAARAVNFDGMKYVWDEFDFLKRLLDCVALRRY